MTETKTLKHKFGLTKSQRLELASDCGKLSTQVAMLCPLLDTIIKDEAQKELLQIRDGFLKKYFELISKTLKKASYEIRRVVLEETNSDEADWKKLGRDSQRLGFFSHNILNLIEIIIGDTDDQKVKRLQDDYFKTCLLRATGLLKMVSTGIRSNLFFNNARDPRAMGIKTNSN